MVLLHQCEWVVRAVAARVVEIGEVFEVRPMPRKLIPAKDQNAGPFSDTLRRSEPRLEMKSCV